MVAISQNTKCTIKDSFCRDSHIRYGYLSYIITVITFILATGKDSVLGDLLIIVDAGFS